MTLFSWRLRKLEKLALHGFFESVKSEAGLVDEWERKHLRRGLNAFKAVRRRRGWRQRQKWAQRENSRKRGEE